MSETPSDLPEAFREARRNDEPFWQNQEKRIQGALGQPCCTLSGISTGLINMEGDFAVVVHGEDECAACFRHVGVSAAQFYCDGLTEKEFVTGETSEPLEACLRAVAEETSPEAIFVLGACPVEVIGDRFELVVDKVQKDHPTIPMVPLHTSGLKVGSQAAMLDWMFSTLAAIPGTVPPVDQAWRKQVGLAGMDLVFSYLSKNAEALSVVQEQAANLPERRELASEHCANFVGLPRSTRRGDSESEVATVLREAGVELVANFPRAATFQDWRAIKHAKATFIADRSLYPKLVNVLEGHGQEVLEVPLPTGVAQTDDFYRTVGEVYGVSDGIFDIVAREREAAMAAVETFKARYAGLKVAMGIRMLNNYEADQLAYMGLGDYRALAELGFDLTLMVQGPPDKAPKFQAMFDRRGVEHPFEVFPEPWNLSEHLGGGRFDVAYLADHCRGECRKAGVPMIVSRELEPYYSGVGSNLEHLDRLLRQTLSSRSGS